MTDQGSATQVEVRALPSTLFTPFVTVLLGWRGVMPLLVTAILVSVLLPVDGEERQALLWLTGSALAVLVLNLGAIALVRQGGSAEWAGHRATLAVDVGVVLALLLLNARVLPEETFLLEARDVFNAYVWGAAALWTFLRSPWVGLAIVGLGAAIQVLGILLNGYPLEAVGSMRPWMRQIWGPVAVALVGVMALIVDRAVAEQREGARLRAEAAHERAEAALLVRAHDEVLPLLSAIVRVSESGAPSAGFERIRRLALQADDVVRERFEHPGPPPGEICAGVAEMVQASRERQREAPRPARVRRSLPDFEPRVSDEARAALLAATDQALGNAERHAQADTITVSVEADGRDVRVVVADDGVGFDPETVGRDRFGVRGAIQQRLASAGGRAALDTAPGQGCVWELSVPQDSAGKPPEPGVVD